MEARFLRTGLDKSLPHIGVIMEKRDTAAYPRFELPKGYRFSAFEPGFEARWARLQHLVGHVDSLQEAEEVFQSGFLLGCGTDWAQPRPPERRDIPAEAFPCYEEMRRRLLFVTDAAGDVVGTGVLWPGRHFGIERQRLHWVAVHPDHQGRGIAKALVTRLLDLYNELGYAGYVYLTSQTWSYRALSVYGKFGFRPYLGAKPPNWLSVNLASQAREPWDYEERNREAWAMIQDKIDAYERSRRP